MALAASVFHFSRDAIMLTTLDGTIVAVNAAFCAITGYTQAEVVGRNPRLLKSGRQGPGFYRAMWDAIGRHGYWQGEAWNRRKDGTQFAERLTISTAYDEHGQPHHYIAVFADITGASNQQRALEQRAHYDALTGLPNRLLLYERLASVLAQARACGGTVALAFIDLDGFKSVNDTLGHAAGDSVLVTMGQRLRNALRDADMLARLGGDEFVAVLPSVRDEADLAALVDRMAAAARAPVALYGRIVCLSASIGVALFPRDGGTPEALIGHADAQMYAAKRGPHDTPCPAPPAATRMAAPVRSSAP